MAIKDHYSKEEAIAKTVQQFGEAIKNHTPVQPELDAAIKSSLVKTMENSIDYIRNSKLWD